MVHGCYNTVILYAYLNYRVMGGEFFRRTNANLERAGTEMEREKLHLPSCFPFFCSAPSNRANLGDRN